MKILNFFFLLCLCIQPSHLYAEIFYIDIDKIINDTNVGKHINKNYENLIKENNSQNQETKRELKKREESLIAQKKILDENEFNNKLNIFRNDVVNFNQLNKKINKDLQNKLMNNKNNFLKLVEPLLLNYVSENNITYLLQKKYIIIGHNDLNKTSDIIKLVDKKINISNFNDSISK